MRVRGLERKPRRLVLEIAAVDGPLAALTVELTRGSVLVARAQVARLDGAWRRLVVRPLRGRRLTRGHYLVTVREGELVVAASRVRVDASAATVDHK